MSDPKSENDSLTPMKRVNKINALLDHLPKQQRASLLHRLENSAPQLISSKKGKEGNRPIDTPMRRARAIARRLTRGELPQESESPSISETFEPETAPPLSYLLDHKGRSLLMIYQSSPLESWLKALKIAEPELKEHLLIHLPAREKTELEEALRQLGPVKLSEAQSASEQVMRTALELERQGKIKRL